MDLDSIFHSYIGRIVAFVVAPLCAFAAPPVINAVNSVLGTDFSDQQLSNIAIATVVGLAGVAWQWLKNRGEWEKAVLEVEKLYEAGRQEIASADGPDPTTPPGVITGGPRA